MRITLSTIRRQTQRALREQGFDRVAIESVAWLTPYGSATASDGVRFRSAAVTLRTADGRRVRKSATADSTGYFRIA